MMAARRIQRKVPPADVPHVVSAPLPDRFGTMWSFIRGIQGQNWLKVCSRCGTRGMIHYAPSSLLACRRFRPGHRSFIEILSIRGR